MPTLAQTLRKNPTAPEIRFWRLIGPLRLNGHHFRKQAKMGPYVVDFVCHAAKLVIEIDGETHFTEVGIARDAVRTAALSRHGYRMLRFTNEEVMHNPDGVYATVTAALGVEQPEDPLPSPPLKGEGD